jgi:hypothetical protein
MSRMMSLFLFLCFTAAPFSLPALDYDIDYARPSKKLILSFKTVYGVNGSILKVSERHVLMLLLCCFSFC